MDAISVHSIHCRLRVDLVCFAGRHDARLCTAAFKLRVVSISPKTPHQLPVFFCSSPNSAQLFRVSAEIDDCLVLRRHNELVEKVVHEHLGNLLLRR